MAHQSELQLLDSSSTPFILSRFYMHYLSKASSTFNGALCQFASSKLETVLAPHLKGRYYRIFWSPYHVPTFFQRAQWYPERMARFSTLWRNCLWPKNKGVSFQPTGPFLSQSAWQLRHGPSEYNLTVPCWKVCYNVSILPSEFLKPTLNSPSTRRGPHSDTSSNLFHQLVWWWTPCGISASFSDLDILFTYTKLSLIGFIDFLLHRGHHGRLQAVPSRPFLETDFCPWSRPATKWQTSTPHMGNEESGCVLYSNHLPLLS